MHEKMWIRREFWRAFVPHAATPVDYPFINIYNNNAPILKFNVHRPTKNEKGTD